VNHGIQLSPDGTQLFLSSAESVWSLPYSAKDTKVTGTHTTWVTGMSQLGHISRTLLMSKKAPGILLVSRGSGPNVDPLARDINSGVSQIRSFNVSGIPKSVKYIDGRVIAWGLRNSIGLGENPADGGIWSNENASDGMKRQGKDIHETSPGEEINYHGDLIGKSELHGKNYGYPECAAVWDVSALPTNEQLKIGGQFTYSDTVAAVDDNTCEKNYIPPRLALPSHWAPIDIEFNSKGTVAYMTSHGSWSVNRDIT
jgi:glucose/arabinose dehydrogenase